MKCIACGCLQSKVIDSRLCEDGTSIRRRRECEACGRRFTTYEKVETIPIMVVKRDETREEFNLSKIRRGIVRACYKRPVSQEQIDEMLRAIEQKVYSSGETEISSQDVGEMVMDQIRKYDEVSYVRFASVYRQFKDIQTFMDELSKLLATQNMVSPDGTKPSEKYR